MPHITTPDGTRLYYEEVGAGTPVVFSIVPKLVTITPNSSQSKIYGGSDPTLTYTRSDLANGDTDSVFTGALARATGENVGTYAITQGTLTAGGDYALSYTGANLTVTPRPITVTANDNDDVSS